jgi:hypothetical protein
MVSLSNIKWLAIFRVRTRKIAAYPAFSHGLCTGPLDRDGENGKGGLAIKHRRIPLRPRMPKYESLELFTCSRPDIAAKG